MKPTYMPYSDQARIEPQKLTGYLLSLTHPTGAAKATAFLGMGYSLGRPQSLFDALTLHAKETVAEVIPTPYGNKYVIEAYLSSSDESVRVRFVRSVWMVSEDNTPRLITAYPIPRAT